VEAHAYLDESVRETDTLLSDPAPSPVPSAAPSAARSAASSAAPSSAHTVYFYLTVMRHGACVPLRQCSLMRLVFTAVALSLSESRGVRFGSASNMDCRKDWAGTWTFSPARFMFTGNLTVTQSGCLVSEYWWEHVTDWHCRGQWLTGWIEIRKNYTALGQEITPSPSQPDDCSGDEGWRPSKMVLSPDGKRAKCSSEVWSKVPPAPPKPLLPLCLPLGECAIGFVEGFGPPCCNGSVLQQDYSSKCQHPAGKYGYPEAGLSCQRKACLVMGTACVNDREGCCPGLSCQDMGISGFMCV